MVFKKAGYILHLVTTNFCSKKVDSLVLKVVYPARKFMQKIP